MKILNPYRFIKGAGSGGSASTPALSPPKSATSFRKTISVLQNVDILCEGPIYGLVDQFGKKVYGLDMLKGIYLNGAPVMNNKGEYNFRNILMEINLGTENQKPLPNFKNVEIFKPANFKLLGPIKAGKDDIRQSPQDDKPPKPPRNFTSWARETGDWPSEDKDPFIYVHKIRNKDVSKLKISILVEALMDTVDSGTKGVAEDMGMNKETTVELLLKYGLENSNVYRTLPVVINGTATSPYAYMIGEGEAAVATTNSSNGSLLKLAGGATYGTSSPSNSTNSIIKSGWSSDTDMIPDSNLNQN